MIIQLPTHTTLTSEVEGIVRQAILEGAFEAGQRLTESRIARQLNVSRAPVREALGQLEQEGLVVRFPHRGYFIPDYDIADVEELFLLRMALEKLAIGLAIDRASSDDMAELAAKVDEMEKASAENARTITIASELDFAFHRKVCDMAHHARLTEIWSNMADQITLAILYVNRSFLASWSLAQGHREILEAMRRGDRRRAEEVIERHMLQGLENLKSTL